LLSAQSWPRRPIAQPVERDIEDVLDPVGRRGWVLPDATDYLQDVIEVRVVAHGADLLGARAAARPH